MEMIISGAPLRVMRLMQIVSESFSRMSPRFPEPDKKKRVKVKLPLRQRLHEVISKFGSLEVMEKAVHG